MYRWIKKDQKNVVVIHCNSGKGRAGTACTSLLLYIGAFDNILECARLFGSRRFTDDKGVS
jgi:protein-tyrosine phosphatase